LDAAGGSFAIRHAKAIRYQRRRVICNEAEEKTTSVEAGKKIHVAPTR
jgi:hypothetical protein